MKDRTVCVLDSPLVSNAGRQCKRGTSTDASPSTEVVTTGWLWWGASAKSPSIVSAEVVVAPPGVVLVSGTYRGNSLDLSVIECLVILLWKSDVEFGLQRLVIWKAAILKQNAELGTVIGMNFKQHHSCYGADK